MEIENESENYIHGIIKPDRVLKLLIQNNLNTKSNSIFRF